MEIEIGRHKVEVPNQSGCNETELGPIEVEIIGGSSRVWKVALEGEIMRGTPLKNRHKRNPRKVVSLNESGYGAQTLSKRETVYVDLYPENRDQVMRDMRLLFRDDGY